MAEKEKEHREDTSPESGEKKKSGNILLIIIIVVLVLVLIIGGVVAFLMMSNSDAKSEAGSETKKEASVQAPAKESVASSGVLASEGTEVGIMFPLDPLRERKTLSEG
jgi:flagellar protein FliL